MRTNIAKKEFFFKKDMIAFCCSKSIKISFILLTKVIPIYIGPIIIKICKTNF